MNKNKPKHISFTSQTKPESFMSTLDQVKEVKEETVESTPRVVQPVKQPTPTPTAAKPAVKEEYKGIYRVEVELQKYTEKMFRNKETTLAEKGKLQYALFSLFKEVLANPSQELFNREWNTILYYFHKNRDTIFNENFMFSHPEQWSGSEKEYVSFRHLAYLLICTSDVKTRKENLSSIRLDRVTESLNEDGKNKILSFYS